MGNTVRKNIGLYLFTFILSLIVLCILFSVLHSAYYQKEGMFISLYPMFYIGMVYSIEGYFFCAIFRKDDYVVLQKSSIIPYTRYIHINEVKRIKSKSETVRSPKGGIQRMPFFYTIRFEIVAERSYKSNFLCINDLEKRRIISELNRPYKGQNNLETHRRAELTVALLPALFRILLLLMGYFMYKSQII